MASSEHLQCVVVVVVAADVAATSLVSFSPHLAVLRTLGYCSPPRTVCTDAIVVVVDQLFKTTFRF